jgi:hypothetical protein
VVADIKVGGDNKINLVDDGSKITNSDSMPATTDAKAIDAIAQSISGSLRSFAQTYTSNLAQIGSEVEQEGAAAKTKSTETKQTAEQPAEPEKPNFRKYPKLIKSADVSSFIAKDGVESGADGENDEGQDEGDEPEPENPANALLADKLSKA